MRLAALALLAWPAPAEPPVAAPRHFQEPAAPAPDTGRPSLEAWLERARQRSSAERERLRPLVVARLGQLTALGPGGPRVQMDAIRATLAELGPASAPLLVEVLDPGPDADETAIHRAREAALALEPIVTVAVTEPLVTLARSGSPLGREHAVHLLGFSAEPGRAGRVLNAIYEEGPAPLGRIALAALARLGSAEHEPLFGAALGSQDPLLVEAALGALASARSSKQAPAVLDLLRRTDSAVAHAESLLAYHLACPEVVGAEEAGAWIDLVASYRLKPTQAVRVLEALPVFEVTRESAVRKRLEGFAETRFPSIREAALLCLALVGDRGARRELLRAYDETIEEFPGLFESHRLRAVVYYRLGEYDKATRDFKKALQQNVVDREERDALLIGLARCYALSDKLKLAAEALAEAWLTPPELSALAADPDFATLLANPKYGAALRGE